MPISQDEIIRDLEGRLQTALNRELESIDQKIRLEKQLANLAKIHEAINMILQASTSR